MIYVSIVKNKNCVSILTKTKRLVTIPINNMKECISSESIKVK